MKHKWESKVKKSYLFICIRHNCIFWWRVWCGRGITARQHPGRPVFLLQVHFIIMQIATEPSRVSISDTGRKWERRIETGTLPPFGMFNIWVNAFWHRDTHIAVWGHLGGCRYNRHFCWTICTRARIYLLDDARWLAGVHECDTYGAAIKASAFQVECGILFLW